MKNVQWHQQAELQLPQDPAVPLLVRATKVEVVLVLVQGQVPVVVPVPREVVTNLRTCLSVDDLSTDLQIFI